MSYSKELSEMINTDINNLKNDIEELLKDEKESKYSNYKSGEFCLKCNSNDFKIADTRVKNGFRVRSKKCKDCGARWRTIEIIDWS